jgi:hypothetical protein
MSKEILIIVIGALLVVQTQFGIPDSWHTTLVVLLGFSLVLVGFLQRTDALSHGAKASRSLPFKESSYAQPQPPAVPTLSHDRKEGIGSLN